MNYSSPEKPHWLLGHYYGDTVRRLFLAGAVVMLLSIPISGPLLFQNLFVGVIVALVLTLLAGLTNPRQRGVALISAIVSAVAFVLFEMAALQSFSMYNANTLLFFLQQILALNFLLALYFSIKSWRGIARLPPLQE